MILKYISITIYVVIILTGCASVKQIGDINMISNRNIDHEIEYKVITTYSGGSKKELKKSKATSMQAALDQTVRKVPGGEYLMNAKIYLIKGKYIAVEGDVWGATDVIQSYRGFKIGDNVMWKELGTFYSGKITALKDDKSCYVQSIDGNKTHELKYERLTKSSDTNVLQEIVKPPENKHNALSKESKPTSTLDNVPDVEEPKPILVSKTPAVNSFKSLNKPTTPSDIPMLKMFLRLNLILKNLNQHRFLTPLQKWNLKLEIK